MHSAVVIPALNPSPALIDLIKALLSQGIPQVVVVNDGSGQEYKSIFEEISRLEHCTLLTHEVNRGKGRALKTAFAYCLENLSYLDGVVTADADCQHSVEDICRVATSLANNKHAMILGARDFSEPQVPRRSYLGNTVTSRIFQLLYGCYLRDTQTGLRGLASEDLPWLSQLPGERFEYEINMLIQARRRHIPLVEVTIQTIYINNNCASHYCTLRDSSRIFYRLTSGFILYTLSSSISGIIDISTFIILNGVLLKDMPAASRLLVATVIARIISSISNFSLNNNLVFKNGNRVSKCAARYYTLWFIQLCSSYTLIYLASTWLNGIEALMKAAIDLILAAISYQIQLHWVFKENIAQE